MAKRNKKRVSKKVKVFLSLILFIILTIISSVLLCTYVFDVKAKAIIIHGNDIVTDEEVLESINMVDYPNFFLANSKDIKKALKTNGFINKVTVKKNVFMQIHIYVEENKPLFIREDTNMIVFDKNSEIPNDKTKELTVPYLINYVPNTKYDEFIKKMKLIDYNLIKKISQIKYEPTKYDEDRFVLYMNDSNRVYINLPKFKSFNRYDEMVTKFEGKTGKLYLDSGNYFEIDK